MVQRVPCASVPSFVVRIRAWQPEMISLGPFYTMAAMQLVCRDFVLSFALFEGIKICCKTTLGIFCCPCPSLPLPFPQSAKEYNGYFAPYHEESTPDTVDGVESRGLQVPGCYVVTLLELLGSHLGVLEGQRVGEKDEVCVAGSGVVVSEDAAAEIWGTRGRQGQRVVARRS